MKTLVRLAAVLCFTACVTSARAELSPVAFDVGQQQFKSGDSIVIDEVLASSPRFELGTTVVVRGHYRLASYPRATLGFYLTHRSPAGPDATAPFQVAKIDQPTGSFELRCEISYEGDPHVSFYPSTGGESFGGVYFSAARKI